MGAESMTRRIVTYVALTIGLIPILLPLYWMVVTALKDKSEVFTATPQWWPTHLAWSNFAAAWNAEPFARFFVNSVVVTVTIVGLQVITASLAAYALARFQFAGRRAAFISIIAALIVPLQITFIANFITLAHLGWLNTYAALIVPYAASAFGTFLLRQAFM